MGRFTHHVFVCDNRRPDDDPKGCCASKGSAELIPALRELVKQHGLTAKVRINASGCLANCARGASVVVYPEGIWYSQITIDDVPEIFHEHLLNGRIVTRLLDPKFHADMAERR